MNEDENNDVDYCPKCKELRKFKFYDGALGYESRVCSKCGFDANDVTINDLTALAKRKLQKHNSEKKLVKV